MAMHLEIGKKFAEVVWQKKGYLHIEDILLYGSVARNKPNPSDIDLMVFHNGNTAFERIQQLRHNDGCANNLGRYIQFRRILEEENYQHAPDLAATTELIEAMTNNVLNVQFLDIVFFTNPAYKNSRIASSEDPNFFENIFRDGRLWNPTKRDFITRVAEKYQI